MAGAGMCIRLTFSTHVEGFCSRVIRPGILQRVYPTKCGPEARTPPLKLQNVSCRRYPLTDHPRLDLHGCNPWRIVVVEYYPVLRGSLSAGTKRNHWCMRGIVGAMAQLPHYQHCAREIISVCMRECRSQASETAGSIRSSSACEIVGYIFKVRAAQ
jgi:hypothetical protein